MEIHSECLLRHGNHCNSLRTKSGTLLKVLFLSRLVSNACIVQKFSGRTWEFRLLVLIPSSLFTLPLSSSPSRIHTPLDLRSFISACPLTIAEMIAHWTPTYILRYWHGSQQVATIMEAEDQSRIAHTLFFLQVLNAQGSEST